MQSGLNRLAAGARQAGKYRRYGRLCVLLLGLMVSGCAGIGPDRQSDRRAGSVGRLRIDRRPAARGAREIHARAQGRGRGPPDHGRGLRRGRITACAAIWRPIRPRGATSVSWAWDVYDSSQRRALRLKGEDTASGGTGWANVDDQVLRRIARSGLDQLAGFAAAPRQQTAAAEPAPAQPEKPASNVAWLDDWAPEAAGIFRIFRRDEPKADVASAPAPARSAEAAPRGRPSPDEAPAKALSFAPEGR